MGRSALARLGNRRCQKNRRKDGYERIGNAVYEANRGIGNGLATLAAARLTTLLGELVSRIAEVSQERHLALRHMELSCAAS